MLIFVESGLQRIQNQRIKIPGLSSVPMIFPCIYPSALDLSSCRDPSKSRALWLSACTTGHSKGQILGLRALDLDGSLQDDKRGICARSKSGFPSLFKIPSLPSRAPMLVILTKPVRIKCALAECMKSQAPKRANTRVTRT